MSADLDGLKAAEKEQLFVELDETDVTVEKATQREQEDQACGRRGHKPWGMGLILIAVGVALLASNTVGLHLTNWWALFILIPAVSSIRKGFAIREETGHYPKPAREAFGWGVVLLLAASMFLFGVDWSVFWPVMLIGVGISAIINNTLR
jgi:hypothetical protein